MTIDCTLCPIRKFPIFAQMDKETLAFMRKFKVGEMVVDPGTPVLTEGAKTPQLYTALSGMGLRYNLLEDGRRQVIGFVFPGDFIGLQAGVMEGMEHSFEATTAMRLCVFDRSELWSLFRQMPQRGFDLTWLAANEERFLGEAITALGQKSATERIAWALARVFRRLSMTGLEKNGSVPFPFRQQDLADALGLSLVHTNKTLGRLREEQLLTWSDRFLRVPDLTRLEKVAMIDECKLPVRPLM